MNNPRESRGWRRRGDGGTGKRLIASVRETPGSITISSNPLILKKFDRSSRGSLMTGVNVDRAFVISRRPSEGSFAQCEAFSFQCSARTKADGVSYCSLLNTENRPC